MNQNLTVEQIKGMLNAIEAVQGGEHFVRVYSQALNALIIARGGELGSSGYQELVNNAWTITLSSLTQLDSFLRGQGVNQTRVA